SLGDGQQERGGGVGERRLSRHGVVLVGVAGVEHPPLQRQRGGQVHRERLWLPHDAFPPMTRSSASVWRRVCSRASSSRMRASSSWMASHALRCLSCMWRRWAKRLGMFPFGSSPCPSLHTCPTIS